MVFSVPKGHTVSRWPSTSTGFTPPALDFGPKRASKTSPICFCLCSFTRPPRLLACSAARATQASTAALSSVGDSTRTSRWVRSISAGSLRRAPASSARIESWNRENRASSNLSGDPSGRKISDSLILRWLLHDRPSHPFRFLFGKDVEQQASASLPRASAHRRWSAPPQWSAAPQVPVPEGQDENSPG